MATRHLRSYTKQTNQPSPSSSLENPPLPNKTRTIATHPTPQNLSKCNPQTASPLFNKLPPEIRNTIFSLALAQYEDLANPYPTNDHAYRAAHRARRITSTALLLTSRLVWLEANHWPLSQATHSFWYDHGRRPPWTKHTDSEAQRFRLELTQHLTPANHAQVKHIQLFAQMYWLEQSFASSPIWRYIADEGFKLDTFGVYVRHSDWWMWEDDEALRFHDGWLRDILDSDEASGVAEFRLELETLEWKMDQLRPIIAQLSRLGDAAKWTLAQPFEESTWSGPTDLGGFVEAPYRERAKLEYRVVTMTWKRVPGTLKTAEPGRARWANGASGRKGRARAPMVGVRDLVRWEGEGSLMGVVEGTWADCA